MASSSVLARRIAATRAATTGLVLVGALTVGVVPAYAGTSTLPDRLSHLGKSRQVVTVTSSSWSTSYAKLSTWRKRKDGNWRRVIGPVPARIGYAGFALAADRLQGTGTTPAGTFRIGRGFGSNKDPGTAMPYRRFDRNDYWPGDPRDPRTYNVYQFKRASMARWRTSWAERLWDFRAEYAHAAVIRYNMPHRRYRADDGQRFAKDKANTTRGGAIFLHVNGDDDTAGCVSVSARRMRKLLRWFDPDRVPRIVMGPKDEIGSM